MFDPEKKNHGAGPIWVHLPALPLQFRWEEIFKVIGDDLGVYLDHNRTYQDTGCMAMAHILVHLDTREGLVESYLLLMGDITHRQILDYEGIPFCCWKCHEVGHFYKYCPRISGQIHIPTKLLVSSSTKTQESDFPSPVDIHETSLPSIQELQQTTSHQSARETEPSPVKS